MEELFVYIGFLLLFACVVPEVTAGACPSGFVTYESYCYKVIINMLVSWADAKMFCYSMHSRLAVVDSLTKETYLQSNIVALNVSHYNLWIDGTDLAEEGTWMWMSANVKIGYTNWHSGQPDNDKGAENCLEFISHPTESYWNDAVCTEHRAFICETSLTEDWSNNLNG